MQRIICKATSNIRAEVPQKILPEIAAERRPRLRVNPASVVPSNPLQNDVALQQTERYLVSAMLQALQETTDKTSLNNGISLP
jgi:hypothetical protein